MTASETAQKQDTLALSSVNGVSLDLKAGDDIALLLLKGASAESFIKTVSGLDMADANKIFWNGERLEHARLEAPISYLSSSLPMMGWRSVKANVGFPLEVQSVARKERQERVNALLNRLGVNAKSWTFPATLPKTDQAVSCVARAFVADPAIIAMDNPFSGLADDVAEGLTAMVRELWLSSSSKFMFYATTRVSEAVIASKRILVCRGASVNRSDEPQLRVIGEVTHDGFDAFYDQEKRRYVAAEILATDRAAHVMQQVRTIIAKAEE